MRLAEGGLPKLWQESTANTLIQRAHVKRKKAQLGDQSFSLQNLKTPFYVLFSGYALSFIVFICEKLVPPVKLDKIRGRLSRIPTLKRQ